jgi:quercetin dioxygenase-like cupin family protein
VLCVTLLLLQRICSGNSLIRCNHAIPRLGLHRSEDTTGSWQFCVEADFGYFEHAQHEETVIMKVVTLKDIPNVPVEGAERIEGWTGPVSRSRQTIIEPGDSANYNCSVVNFSQGCTTGWHTHSCDQILVVTSGSGMVATEHEQREINIGDVVHIKAGERHWHGAKANTTMGHITITAVGGQATWG